MTKGDDALSFSMKVIGPGASADADRDEHNILSAGPVCLDPSVGEHIGHLNDPDAWCDFFLDVLAMRCTDSKTDADVIGSLIYYGPLQLTGEVSIMFDPQVEAFDEDIACLTIAIFDKERRYNFVRPVGQVPDTIVSLVWDGLRTMRKGAGGRVA